MVHVIHKLLVLTLVHNRDDFIVFLPVVGADGLIDRSPAVQIVDDKFPKLLFFFRDDTDAALDVMIENEVIQDNTIEIGSKNT